MERSVSIGVLLLFLLGAAATASPRELTGDSQTQAVAWTRLDSEPWDEQLGCSVAIRNGPLDGTTAVLVRAGNLRDFSYEPLPTVVDFVAWEGWSGASDWFRMGGVLVGSDPGRCPGITSAGLYDAAALPWGDTAVLIGKQTGSDPTFTDTEVFWPIANQEYSQSVDVSEDGTVAIVYSGGAGVEVLRASGDTWTQQVLDVPARSVAVADEYIVAAGWSSDGRRIWVFWKRDLAKSPVPYEEIVVPSGLGWYGYSIDADGPRIVVGAPGIVGGGSTGTVYVATLRGNTWSTETLPQSVPEHEDAFGEAVAIEGGRIVVGASLADANGQGSGLVYIYEWDGTRWTETKAPVPIGAFSAFGRAVALSGTTLAVGAPDDVAGSVWVTRLPDRGAFIDDDGSVFVNAIEWMATEGITRGCNPPWNDEYCPTDAVTRGEMAVFLVRARGYSDNGGGDLFVDDDGLFYENAADRLFTAGVTLGCNPPANDRFCGERRITRGEMAAFLSRAFKLPAYTGPDRFVDDNGHLFEGAIERLAQAGITVGCNPPVNDRFCPDDYVTRGQMAAFLKRALD